MSGLEPLAVIGVAAGLIQAFDSGIRIVKQIKERRRAHGALPPPTLLEESFITGKREIENVMEEGARRFGPTFAKGDETARLAILQITVQAQAALLERLTEAREDDDVVDFDLVIDLSDKGRNDALLELRQLFSRRLQEEMALKLNAVVDVQEVAVAPAPIPAPAPARAPTMSSPPAVRAPEGSRPQAPSPLPRRPGPQLDARTAAPSPSPTPTSPVSRPSSRFWGRISRADSRSSTTSSPAPSEADRASIFSRSDRRQSMRSVSSFGTNVSLQGGVSAASTSNSTSGIQKYGGFCKYAHETRDKKPEAGVRLLDNGLMYKSQFVYQCKSSSCEFQGGAVNIRGKWEIDTRVRTSSSGLKYRWIFLAKSHVARPKGATQASYLCLLCTMLRRDSETYAGHEELFVHIASHTEPSVGEVSLQGPLKFTNAGLQVEEKAFDIYLPTDIPPESTHGQAMESTTHAFDRMGVATRPSFGADTGHGAAYGEDPLNMEPEANPWAMATQVWTATR